MSDETIVVPAEPVKYGIEDLWILIQAVLEVGNVAGEIKKKTEDATINWFDKYIVPSAKLSDDVFKLFSVKYRDVIPAFKDIDEAEKAELLRRAVEKFDIPQDSAELIVEKSFVMIVKLGDIIKEIIEMVAALKK